MLSEERPRVLVEPPDHGAHRLPLEDAERALYGLAQVDKYGAGFQSFSQVLAKTLDMAAKAR